MASMQQLKINILFRLNSRYGAREISDGAPMISETAIGVAIETGTSLFAVLFTEMDGISVVGRREEFDAELGPICGVAVSGVRTTTGCRIGARDGVRVAGVPVDSRVGVPVGRGVGDTVGSAEGEVAFVPFPSALVLPYLGSRSHTRHCKYEGGFLD